MSSRTKSSLLSSSIGKILSSCQLIGKSVLTDLFLLVAHDWILSDILNLNIDAGSSIVENPISKCLDEFSSFILDCIVCKSSLESQYIMVAANFIYLELSPFIERIVGKILFLKFYKIFRNLFICMIKLENGLR